MAKIVGIICEYNPFHKGHKYQIDKIREDIPDAKIVAIMSGNATQRGIFPIFEKHRRAESALLSGVDLVLELPFPYSSSCAEIFALGGVQIAEKIGCDYLYFGTENTELCDLYALCAALDSSDFEIHLKHHLTDKKASYIEAREKALFDLGFSTPLLSNDMLALEYVRAIKSLDAKVEPRVIKRIGKGYNDTGMDDIMSASGIRQKYYKDGELVSVPKCVYNFYLDLIKDGKILDFSAFKSLLYRHALMVTQIELEDVFDSTSELSALIKKSALSAKNADNFLDELSSKNYTRSRILRVLLCSIFKVKTIEKQLNYTRLLGANSVGREIIKNSKKSALTIITKHADARNLTESEKKYLELDYSLDMLYLSILKDSEAPNNAFKKLPIFM